MSKNMEIITGLNKTGVRKRNCFLDYLKAVSVLLVIITHYDWQEKNTIPFVMFINMAVPIFMIVSGYNFAMSYQKKTDGKFFEMYRASLLIPRMKRFLEPFVVICLVELGFIVAQNKHINLPRIFLFGAYGPGSYYVPLMMQLFLVFPVIFLLVNKWKAKGVLAVGGVNLLYEVMVAFFDLDTELYRLCIGRYLLLLGLGVYLYLYGTEKINKRAMLGMLSVGMLHIVLVLLEIELPLFKHWTPTTMPIAGYIFPIMVILFRKCYQLEIPGKIGEGISQIGMASYHIYLVQMVYYHFEVGGKIMKLEWYYAIPYNMILCLALGLGFYQLEKQVRILLKENHKVPAFAFLSRIL